MQGDAGGAHAACRQRRQQRRREMQPGGGCGHRALMRREHRLVIRRILRGGPSGPGDIGRQGQRAVALQGTLENRPRRSKRSVPPPCVAPLHGGAETARDLRITSPGLQPARVARQRVPGAVRQRPVQRDADAGGAARAPATAPGSPACRSPPAGRRAQQGRQVRARCGRPGWRRHAAAAPRRAAAPACWAMRPAGRSKPKSASVRELARSASM